MAELNTATQQAQGFASELGIDLDPDLKGGLLVPQIVQVDPVTGSMRHINDGRGSDYYAARIDFKYGQAPVASRAVAVVMPGARTNLGYRPLGADPKELSIHRGHGYFIVGDPHSEDDAFQTEYYPVDPAVTPRITLQPGKFYTLEAADWCELVVSGLSEIDSNGEWQDAEIPVEPGTEVLQTPDGPIQVPDDFIVAQFD